MSIRLASLNLRKILSSIRRPARDYKTENLPFVLVTKSEKKLRPLS